MLKCVEAAQPCMNLTCCATGTGAENTIFGHNQNDELVDILEKEDGAGVVGAR